MKETATNVRSDTRGAGHGCESPAVRSSRRHCVMGCLTAAFLLAAPEAYAQANEKGWSLGLGVVAYDSVYATDKTRILPVPVALYEGERFFFRGPSLGAHLFKSETFTFNVIVAVRGDGIEASDLDANKLRLAGIDASVVRDRRYGIDLGAGLQWRNSFGLFDLEHRQDISGASGGALSTLTYSAPIVSGPTTFLPHVAIKHYSAKSANYYYGTWRDEIARGAPDYRPGAYTSPELGLTVLRQLGERWSAVGAVTVERVPDEVTRSPLADRDRELSGSLTMALLRKF